MIITAHLLAEDELADGAVYYAKEGTPKLGEDFLVEFERSIKLLQVYPKLGTVWRGKFRRLPLRRFPFSIVYYLSADILRVVAVAHQRRKPGYWQGRV